MKVMTFNTQHCLNFLEQKIDFQIMADTILQCNPDIVGLNEIRSNGTTPEYEDQTKILSEMTGMKHYYFAKAIDFYGDNNPCGSEPYGNALLSKIPIESCETILVSDPNPKTGSKYYETRCLLKAVLENGVTVLVTHFGLNDDEQENSVAAILEHLEPEKCILMGDFNVTPTHPVLQPIHKRMRDSAEQISGNIYTFPSDKPEVKIDYIFTSPDIEVKEAEIPEIIASDHRPHTAVLQVASS